MLSLSEDSWAQPRQRTRDELLAVMQEIPPLTPGDLARSARLRVFERLADHPDAEVAARARQLVELTK